MSEDFAGLEARVAGIYLWGSHATGRAHARSDIDVCVVAGPGVDAVDALLWGLEAAVRANRRYDVRVFEELPLFLKGAVLDEGQLALARDRATLADYLRPWARAWEGQKRRLGQAASAPRVP